MWLWLKSWVRGIDVRSVAGRLFGQIQMVSISIPFMWNGGGKVSRLHFFMDEEVAGLDQELCAMLDWARGRSGVQFIITCGLRTVESNDQVGGVQDSAHLKGLGVDLACENSQNRYKIVQALLLAGFNRIGVYDKHIHCDRDPSLPPNVMWTGISH